MKKKILILAAAALAAFAVVASAASARPVTTAIVPGSGTAVAGGTCTCDSLPGVFHRQYTVSFTFTHRGPVAARLYELAAPSADNPPAQLDPNILWMTEQVFEGSGTDTYTTTVCGGLVGQQVYFKAMLMTPGRPPSYTMRAVDHLDFGPQNS